mmetsp:Transcript_2941/g.18497  ORF Transcript_2941/g.18497 Transcript_2941/m.18497 type:complete len:220 (+) Transcript_2941:894-1553(+)
MKRWIKKHSPLVRTKKGMERKSTRQRNRNTSAIGTANPLICHTSTALCIRAICCTCLQDGSTKSIQATHTGAQIRLKLPTTWLSIIGFIHQTQKNSTIPMKARIGKRNGRSGASVALSNLIALQRCEDSAFVTAGCVAALAFCFLEPQLHSPQSVPFATISSHLHQWTGQATLLLACLHLSVCLHHSLSTHHDQASAGDRRHHEVRRIDLRDQRCVLPV